jgi:hypothetical protein
VVEYQVDNGGWAAALAVDGIFDSASENCTFTTATLTDGLHMVQVRARDAAGNVSALVGDNFTVDATAPSLVLDTVPGYTNSSTVAFSGTATDAIGPIASVAYRIDGGAWMEATAPDGAFDELTEEYAFSAADLADGSHIIAIRATDGLGNVTGAADYISCYFIVDTNAPSVFLYEPGVNPTNNNSPSFNGSALDASTPIAVVEYRIDGGDWVAAEAADGAFDELTEEYAFSTADLADGSHTITIRATDGLGNVTGAADYVSCYFIVDTSAPSVSLDQPGGNPTNNNSPSFNGSASDASTPITVVQYRIDGGDWVVAEAADGAFDELGEYVTFTTTGLCDGAHLIELMAIDTAGNIGATVGDYFTIDTTAPLVSIDDIPDSVSRLTDIGGAASDIPPGEIEKVRVSIERKSDGAFWDGSTWVDSESWLDVLGNASWGYPMPALADGQSYRISAVSVDTAGNLSVEDTESFTVVATAPAEADPPAIPEPADDDPPATPEPADADLPTMTDQGDADLPATPDPANAGPPELPEPLDPVEERDSKNSSALWSWLLISGLGISILAAALVARRAKARF